MRINVIGTAGSGKSTFSKKIAEKLDIPCIEIEEFVTQLQSLKESYINVS